MSKTWQPFAHRRRRRGTSNRRGGTIAAAIIAFVSTLTMAPLPIAISAPAHAAATGQDAEAGTIDTLRFGDSSSERDHALAADGTETIQGTAGRPARVAQPTSPQTARLADLRFTMKVHPAKQNYLSLQLSGSDDSAYRTMIIADGEQVGYQTTSDHEPINVGTRGGLPGRFFVTTGMLPVKTTQGREQVEIIVRTYTTGVANQRSRGYYKAVVHTTPAIEPAEVDKVEHTPSPKVQADVSDTDKRALVGEHRATQTRLFNDLSARVDANPDASMSIERYKDDLRFYAEALLVDWSPAAAPKQKRKALERIFSSIDNYTRQYYGDVRSLGNGGHQSDWGGYYGALGEALYIVENLIADDQVYGRDEFRDLLNQPFDTDTSDGANSIAGVDWDGGQLTRGEAWERVLKANFDFARSRLSYIYNQVMYTYEGAWKAHEGLRVIESSFYEGKQRSHHIALEALGAEPFLGEEVLVGPQGEDLDLYHSLFNHDDNAIYNDDYLQIVMRGMAKSKLTKNGEVVRRRPYGDHFTGITEAGLTRENGYVGNYGESTNYLPSWFFRTLDHPGDQRLNNEILKLALRNLHARGLTRYQGTDNQGNRVMYMQQVLDDRNPQFPGKIAYGTEVAKGRTLLYAALEKHMADHPDRYADDQWQPYWNYAREAVGYAQQQMVDHRFFPSFRTAELVEHRYDLRLPETYAYVTEGRATYARFGHSAAGVVLPHTDLRLYTDDELATLGIDRRKQDTEFAWVDVDNLLVTVRDGDTHLHGSLAMRNRGFAGFGRWHQQGDAYEQFAEGVTEGRVPYRSNTIRPSAGEQQMFYDRDDLPAVDRPMALAGELAPVAHQPGVGVVDRDNWREDTPYSGYPELATSRFGRYFVAVNTTRAKYGNTKTFTVSIPAGMRGRSKFRDLVSRTELPVANGTIQLPPGKAVVLDLASTQEPDQPPSQVAVVAPTAGKERAALSWRPAPGATSYRIERATRATGPFRVVSANTPGVSFVDEGLASGRYHYRVVALNAHGAAEPSDPVAVTVTQSHTKLSGAWRHDTVGAARAGDAAVNQHGTITISQAAGAGFAGGDDSVIYQRFRPDALAAVTRLVNGDVALSGRITKVGGSAGGIMMRDSLAPTGRYVYLGADDDGQLILRFRSLDTRADITGMAPGVSGGQPATRSPIVQTIDGFDLTSTPFVKLSRSVDAHSVLAYVSGDGEHWTHVGTVDLPMVNAVHVGVATTGDVTVENVRVVGPESSLVSAATFADRVTTVRWTQPDHVVAYDVYRTRDAAVAATDPVKDAGWEKILDHQWALSLRDQVHGGEMYYKVVGYAVDGATTVSDEPSWVAAEGLEAAIERARSVPAGDYSSTSYAKFRAELDAVEAEADKPSADESALIQRIYAAYDHLMPVFRHSFEPDEPDIWAAAGSAPATYSRTIDPSSGRTGNRSLLFTSTDSSANTGYNLWFHSRKQGTSPIAAEPASRYRVSFWYQLKDYLPGPTTGGYYFIRSLDGTVGIGAEQRNWLPAGDTAPGEWVKFEREYTTTSGPVDNVEVSFGLRGSHGTFRVDDVTVEPLEN